MDAPLRYVNMAKAVSFEVVAADEAKDNLPQTQAHYSVDCQYVNGFSHPVTLVDRNGMKVEIPPTRNPTMGEFVIRFTVSLGRHVNVNVDQLLNNTCAATRTLGAVIQNGITSYRNGIRRSSLDYSVKLEDIQSRGGSLYLSNLDIVISLMEFHLVPHHPRSEAGVRNDLVESNTSVNDVSSFGYSIRIVDSHGTFGDRFININKQVYKVPSERYSTMPDGVYVTSSGPVSGDYALRPPVSKRYSFEEAEEVLSLYPTVDAAKALGDEVAQKEREIKELALWVKKEEQRLKEEKQKREAEFEQRRFELDQERLEDERKRKEEENRWQRRQTQLKEEVAELEHKRNLEMIRAKDGYEQRSLERKETGELVKFLPAVFTGILALFVAYSKAK